MDQKRQKLEILTGDGWVEVNNLTFRSWLGARRLNGDAYHGPVYGLGTEEIVFPYMNPDQRATVVERQTQET